MASYVSPFINIKTAAPLIKKIDEFIIILADRLKEPNQGRLFGSAGPAVDTECLKGLQRLLDLVNLRSLVNIMGAELMTNSELLASMMTGKKTTDYTSPAKLPDAIRYIKGLFAGIVVDEQPLMFAPPGSQKYDDVKLIATALAAIISLKTNENCNKYVRVSNFSKNSTKQGAGFLGIEKFIADATAWLLRQGVNFGVMVRELEMQTVGVIETTKEELKGAGTMLRLSKGLNDLQSTTFRTRDAETKIAELNAKLERLEERRKELSKMPGGSAYDSSSSAAAGGSAASGGAGPARGAGGGSGGGMYGGYRKTRRAGGRKTRRTNRRKTNKHRSTNKSRKNRRHQ